MNRTSLRRRLLAGAVGLALGAAGTLAAASPAYAHHPTISGSAVCDTETGEWVVSWDLGTDSDKFDAIVKDLVTNPADPDVEAAVEGQVIEIGASIAIEQRIAGDSGAQQVSASIVVDFVDPNDHTVIKEPGGSADSGPVALQGTCEPGGGGGGTEPPDDKMPPELDADFFPVVSCDFLVFFVNNRGEEGGITMAFTPNQDAVHGHGPDFLEFLDEFLAAEPGEVVDLPDDVGLITEGDGVGAIGAGETTAAFGPFAPGNAHAHGFEAAEGLVVTVDLQVDGEPVEIEGGNEFAFDELLGDLDCDEGGDDGQGGELPKTGTSTPLIVGGAVALLVLGGGLYLVARRRRVTFTA